MKKVKAWRDHPEEKQLKPPILKVLENDGDVYLVCVDEEGGRIVNLIAFNSDGCGRSRAFTNAKQCLNSNGYDTSFSEWDECGAMIVTTMFSFAKENIDE